MPRYDGPFDGYRCDKCNILVHNDHHCKQSFVLQVEVPDGNQDAAMDVLSNFVYEHEDSFPNAIVFVQR